ncbi:MAG: type II toxin-antitoxin system VapC family toxin [Bryobacteraceae bacterium]
MIVVDASVFTDALIDAMDRGHQARDLLAHSQPVAPAIVDVEVLSSLRRQLRSGTITPDHASFAIQRLRRLDIRRVLVDVLTPRIWELRDNLTPYDAAYVALAEALELPLWTADKRLAQAPGTNCTVHILE